MKRPDETFITFNFDQLWDRYSGIRDTFFCLSERDVAMLLTSLRFAGWPSRWIGDTAGVGSDTYKRALLRANGRYQDLETAISYVEDLEQTLMTSCADALLQGMTAIANAITASARAGNCCCDGATVGPINVYIQGVGTSGQPIYGSQEGLAGNVETGIPDDWTGTAEEWWDRKCRISHHLFDGIMSSFRNLAGISIINLVGGGLAIGYIVSLIGAGIAFPPALVPILIAAVIGIGLSLAVLDQIGDYMESHREDLVCAFYNAKDVTEAYEAFSTYIDEAIAALAIPGAVAPHIRTVALLLASTDTLNQLFDIYIDVAYEGAVCDCTEMPCTFTLTIGEIETMSVLESGNILVTMSSGLDPVTGNRQAIEWAMDGIDAAFSWVQTSELCPAGDQGIVEGWWTHCNPPGTTQLRTAGNQNDGQWAGNWHNVKMWSQYNAIFTYTIEMVCEECA